MVIRTNVVKINVVWWLQAKLSELVCMLEQKSGKMEILRFLTFRLDFNE